jgi:hypothetical protein
VHKAIIQLRLGLELVSIHVRKYRIHIGIAGGRKSGARGQQEASYPRIVAIRP